MTPAQRRHVMRRALPVAVDDSRAMDMARNAMRKVERLVPQMSRDEATAFMRALATLESRQPRQGNAA